MTEEDELQLKDNEKEQLKLVDIIHGFDYLNWSALVAIFLSLWQIAIPFIWVNTGPQRLLGFLNIFFLLFSLIVLFWARTNYRIHKDIQAQQLISHSPNEYENDIHNKVWGKVIYYVSFLFIICFSGLIVGNRLYSNFYTAIDVARYGEYTISDDIRLTKVLLLVQTSTTLFNCLNLIYYAKQSYYLVMAPFDLIQFLGVLLSFFSFSVTFTFIIASYITDYATESRSLVSEFVNDTSIQTILWISFSALVLTIIYTLYNYYNCRSTQPQTNRYFVFGFIFFVFAAIQFANVQILNTDLKNQENARHETCKTQIKLFHRNYLESIGCPNKYVKTHVEGKHVYSLSCSDDDVGLVWEDEDQIAVSRKTNVKACINMNCCYLIQKHGSLIIWNLIIITVFCMVIMMILFGHSVILGMENDHHQISNGPGNYPQILFYLQGLLFLVLLLIYALSGNFKNSLTPAVQMKQNSIQAFQFDHSTATSSLGTMLAIAHDVQKMDINTTPKKYPRQDTQTQIGCEHAQDFLQDPIDLSSFQEDKPCGSGCVVQGWVVCLKGTTGIFSVAAQYHGGRIRVHNFEHFGEMRFPDNRANQIPTDQICFNGESGSLKNFMQNDLYFCSNEATKTSEKQGRVTLVAQQKILIQLPIDVEKIDRMQAEEAKRNIKEKQKREREQEEEKEKEQEEREKHGKHLGINEQFPLKSLTNNHGLNAINGTHLEATEDVITLDDRLWFTLQVYVYNAESGNSLKEAQLTIFPLKQTQCVPENPLHIKIVRQTKTDENGQAVVSNLLTLSEYSIHIRSDGFLFNCMQIDELAIQGQNFMYVRVGLVSNFKQKETFQVMLEWQSVMLDIHLGATFNLDDKHECQVGYFNNQCGLMFTQDKVNIPADVIIVGELGQYDYLFYVEHLGEAQKLRDKAQYNFLKMNDQEQEELKRSNLLLQNQQPTVQLYVKQWEYPAAIYNMPELSDADIQERHPVWLALCIDGQIGDISQKGINSFWTRKSSGITYQDRSLEDSKVLPSADICTQMYKQPPVPR